jgi:mRNA-degrading endonuclease RelE of RelBE toxin-antitoxin system
MNYTVGWKTDAEEELADLWMRDPNRQAVNDAAKHLEELLGDDPLNVGESREGLIRIAFEKPLGVIFDVSPDDRLVTVLHVWSID